MDQTLHLGRESMEMNHPKDHSLVLDFQGIYIIYIYICHAAHMMHHSLVGTCL